MKQSPTRRVFSTMKNLIVVVVLVACGPKSTPIQNSGGSGTGSNEAPVTDTRTDIEKHRDGACETLGPKITACALDDAKQALAAGKVKQKEFDESTKPEILKKNTEEFIKSCKAPKTPYSSRQVRVLEVCQQQESQCEPLLACLDNLNKK